MSKPDDYRRNAASCLQLVDRTNDPAEKMFLLDMAQAWNSLADQADRNSRSDLVYETPWKLPGSPAPSAPQHSPEAQQPVSQQQQQIQPERKKNQDES